MSRDAISRSPRATFRAPLRADVQCVGRSSTPVPVVAPGVAHWRLLLACVLVLLLGACGLPTEDAVPDDFVAQDVGVQTDAARDQDATTGEPLHDNDAPAGSDASAGGEDGSLDDAPAASVDGAGDALALADVADGGDTQTAGDTGPLVDAAGADISPADGSDSASNADSSTPDTSLEDSLVLDSSVAGDTGMPLDDGGSGDVDAAIDGGTTPPLVIPTCDAGDAAWVVRAMRVLLGRRPAGAREVRVLVDLVALVGRKKVAESLTKDPDYIERWAEWLQDEFEVNRAGQRTFVDCFGAHTSHGTSVALATYVRDHGPGAGSSPAINATGADLIRSSLRLDDLTPAYRGYLFQMLVRPRQWCDNPTPLENERLRRRDFGDRFSHVYLHRDQGCAPCHNSQYSTNETLNPATNKFWKIPGHWELAVFGSSSMGPAEDWYAAFKRKDFVYSQATVEPNGATDPPIQIPPGLVVQQPWQLHKACGEFRAAVDVLPDPITKQAWFGKALGSHISIWDVEALLRSGVDKLRQKKVSVDPKSYVVAGDESLAFLLSQRIAHQLWTEVMGHPLTVAHFFPRNAGQRDQLLALTESLIAQQWSLRGALVELVTHPLFNQPAPAAGCGVAYGMPATLNPWSVEAVSPAERGNSVGDGLHRANARVLLRSTSRALDWQLATSFPDAADAEFLGTIGGFVRDAEPGFAGLNFQSILGWEARYGACVRPAQLVNMSKPPNTNPQSCAGRCGDVAGGDCACDQACTLMQDCCSDFKQQCAVKGGVPTDDDWIAALLAEAKKPAQPALLLRDVLAAVKDRLVNRSDIAQSEEGLLAALFGVATIDVPAASLPTLESGTRAFCGVLLKTPDYLMVGLPSATTPTVGNTPKIVVDGETYLSFCEQWAPLTLPAGTWTCTAQAIVGKP